MIATYVTGHGFGHAIRPAEVLRTIRAAEPGRPLAVVTAVPEEMFLEADLAPFTYRRVACDLGERR